MPCNWEDNDELEMLFLFYQLSDELLSENTPDTYALPLHNTFSLIKEISDVYFMLKQHNIINSFYNNYIPIIIDEFFYSLEHDYILKKILDKRLNSICTGLKEAQTNHVLLERWLNLFIQYCPVDTYIMLYKKEIEKLVSETKEKNKLIYCTKNLYIMLIL